MTIKFLNEWKMEKKKKDYDMTEWKDDKSNKIIRMNFY